MTKVINTINLFFTTFYSCEALIKIIVKGFILDKNSYIREVWSQLDFFIVITSIIDALVDSVNLGIVRILRLLRTLRPLRFISHNRSMKLIVTSLLESVSGILNVVIVVILIWIMFAILAINLMQNKLNYCLLPTNISNIYN